MAASDRRLSGTSETFESKRNVTGSFIDDCVLRYGLSSNDEDYKRLRDRKFHAMAKICYTLVAIVILAWFVGATGASLAWIIIAAIIAVVFVRSNLRHMVEEEIRYQKIRVQRQRALEVDETCEWLNLILNRWWVFSSASIFSFMKRIIDPLLQDSKPSVVEAIFLKEMTLGDKTPRLRTIRSWDALSVSGREQFSLKTGCSLHTPPGLALAPTHALSMLCDIYLDSDSFSAILGARVGHKGMGVDLDIGVEHLVLEGRALVTAYLDMDCPFPHISRVTFSFLEQPRVSFRVKMLKTMQMMDMPGIKTWVYSLVEEALATAFVDPSQLEININPNDTFVPEHRNREAYARGILTISLSIYKATTNSTGTDDDKWLVITADRSSHVTSCINSAHWGENCNFLLFQSPSCSMVNVKVKCKRLITTTLAQYDIPLLNYSLDSTQTGESILQKKSTKLGSVVPPIHIKLTYMPVTTLNLDDSHDAIDGDAKESGILCIIIHGADNLVPTSGTTSPYCLVFNKRKKIKTTHFERETLSPKWESRVEFLVTNLSSVCLTFLVCSLPKNPKQLDGDLIGIQTINMKSTTLPLKRKYLPLNINASTPSDESLPSSSSTLTISVLFRPIPSMTNPASMAESVSSSVPVSLSLEGQDDEDTSKKRRINTTWLTHAKTLLTSGEANSSRPPDLEGILATGLGLIELTIIKARDLVAKDLNGYSDPYCVLKINDELKYRTQVKKKTLYPEWNETLMTHLPKPGQNLTLTLWDHDAFGMKDFLGSISLQEDQIRSLSASNASDWFRLEGTKSGCIQIKIRLISDNQEFKHKRRHSPFSKNRQKRQFEESTLNKSTSESTLDTLADNSSVVEPLCTPVRRRKGFEKRMSGADIIRTALEESKRNSNSSSDSSDKFKESHVPKSQSSFYVQSELLASSPTEKTDIPRISINEDSDHLSGDSYDEKKSKIKTVKDKLRLFRRN